jgi:YggT family protein
VVLICALLQVLFILLIVYVVFSWIPRPPEPLLPLVRGVHRIVDPLVRPLRQVVPPIQLGGMGLDISVLVLFFILMIVQGFICA